jgi:hypothetical protein
MADECWFFHDWGTWEMGRYCIPTRKCAKCGKQADKPPQHDWQEMSTYYRCRNCGEKADKNPPDAGGSYSGPYHKWTA